MSPEPRLTTVSLTDAGKSQAAPAASYDSGQAPQRASRARKAFLILGALVLLLLLGIGGYVYVTRNQETTDDAQIDSDIVPVAARISGQIRQLLVEDNRPVKKGDLLIQLDDAEFAARLEQAQAELAIAEAQAQAAEAQEEIVEASASGGLRSAKASLSGSSVAVAGAEAQVAVAKAAVVRAEADEHKAKLDLDRAKELRAGNAVSQERLDNAQAAFDAAQAASVQAKAALLSAEESHRGAESRVDEAQGRLAQSSPIEAQIAAAHAASRLAHARIKTAQAAVTLAQLQLSYTKVFAPEDGICSKLTARESQLISIGQPLAELVPFRTYLVANFKETQIGRMRAGDRVSINIDAFPGRTLEGRIANFSGGTGARFSLLPPDNATGNFVKVVQRVPVSISWVNLPETLPLKVGLSATVTVHFEGR